MPTAELIVAAGTVHTLDDRRPYAEAVALAGGVIVGVGSRRDVTDWRGPGTEVIDLGTATVTPGLVDGHLHPVAGIGPTRGVDLSTVTSLPQLVEVLRRAPIVEPGGWVLGWGLNPNAFGSSPLTYAPLVEAREAPVFLLMFDGHAALVSPAALRAAGVDGSRELPGGARIVVDDTGCPTGHLLEIPAYELVAAVLPGESGDVRRGRFRQLLTEMAAVGLTAGNAMDFEGDSEELVTSLAEEMALPLRLRFAPLCLPEVDAAGLDRLVEQQRLGGRRWQVEGVKFMIDGTVDGGTAWLAAPDSLGESTAALWPEPRAYAEAVRRLAAVGVPTVTHAIGDAAVRFVLDTLADLPAGSTRVPHRIEHLETIPDDLLGRFASQDVTASLQPTHGTLYCRADQADNWSRRLGPDRAGRGWRTRDLRAAGARVVLGSDWPVAPYDPRGILADGQLRRPHGQPETSPIGLGQALTARMALEGYTTHAAAAAGLGGQAGQIREGGRADLTAFGLDPLTVPPDELAEAPIPLTVVAGTVVHRG